MTRVRVLPAMEMGLGRYLVTASSMKGHCRPAWMFAERTSDSPDRRPFSNAQAALNTTGADMLYSAFNSDRRSRPAYCVIPAVPARQPS